MKVILIGFLLLGAASAAEVRLYPTFGEVRERVQVSAPEYRVPITQGAWAQLVPGSLDLEGLSVQAQLQRLQLSWLSSQEGRQVTLMEEGRSERVTLVRASDLLIRDTAGRYRHVRFEQLAFDAMPPLNALAPSPSVTFKVASAGPATLSYLTRALSWTPRYTLRLSAAAASLAALADIRSTSDEAVQVTGGELLAGQVTLTQPPALPYARGGVMETAAADMMSAPKVTAAGESRGLHRYTLSQGFTLPPQSTLSVPFLAPKVSFERYAGLTTGFSASAMSGKLGRNYRLKSDVLLPAGPITVRDDGRIVGQADLSDTPAGEAAELDLGADPDVTYTRSVQVLSQDRTGATYRVTLTIHNDKDRQLRAELREMIDGNVSVSGQAERTLQGLLVRVDVPAKGKVTRTFTVTVKYLS